MLNNKKEEKKEENQENQSNKLQNSHEKEIKKKIVNFQI